MLYIKTEGNPYQMGLQYGKALKENIKFHYQKKRDSLHSSVEQIRSRTETYFATLQKTFPDLAKEVEGIAKGADFNLNDLLVLTFFAELIEFEYTKTLKPLSKGEHEGIFPQDCTNVGFIRNCKEPILGQTLDMENPDCLVVHHIKPDKGNELISVGRIGGVILSSGINSSGLCTAQVSTCVKDVDEEGIGVRILRRAVFQYSSSIKDAIKLYSKHNIICAGFTTQIMDKNGQAVIIEKSPTRQVVRRPKPKQSYLYNTLFVTSEMRELLLDYGSSRKRAEARLSTFHRLLKEEEKPYSLETIKRVMSDHSKVGPIWDVSTRSGQIFLPSQGRMFYFEGAPNCTEMEEYRI